MRSDVTVIDGREFEMEEVYLCDGPLDHGSARLRCAVHLLEVVVRVVEVF